MPFYTKFRYCDIDDYSKSRNITSSETSRDANIRLNREKKPR